MTHDEIATLLSLINTGGIIGVLVLGYRFILSGDLVVRSSVDGLCQECAEEIAAEVSRQMQRARYYAPYPAGNPDEGRQSGEASLHSGGPQGRVGGSETP